MKNELLFALQEKVWLPVDGNTWDTLIAQLMQKSSNAQPNIEGEHTQYCDIPFYPDCQLIRTKSLDLTAYFVKTKTGEIHYLDGNSSVIHHLNKSGYLTLTPDNIFQYLVFFCFFVQADKGPFLVLDSMHNPLLALLQDDDGGSMNEYLEPISSYSIGEKGWVTFANVFFDSAVFSCMFMIEPNGDVKMLTDQPIQRVHLKSDDDFSKLKLLDFESWSRKIQHLDTADEIYRKHLLQWTSKSLQ